MFALSEIKRMNADREPLTADQAREIAERQNPNEKIDHLLPVVYAAIRRASGDGKRSVTNPLVGLRTPISTLQRQAVFVQLVSDGYRIGQDGMILW